MPAENLAFLAQHSNRFVYVGLEENPIKNYHQNIQCCPDLVRSGRGKKAVIGVEEFRQSLERPPKAVQSRFLPRHQHDPVANHHIKHHVKDGGGERIPLGEPSVAL